MLQAIVNGDKSYTIHKQEHQRIINDKEVQFDVQWQANGLVSVLFNGRSLTALVEKVDKNKKEVTLNIDGQRYQITIQEEIDLLLSKMGLDLKLMQKAEPVKAPMPGMILKVLVEPGQPINKGDGLLILEAMKMENVLKASGSAVVKSVKVQERTAVEKGAILIELE